ncbi:fimbrial protein [Salmonella enterica]|nr:fimbrial protein [Salmonella enterica]
MVKTGENTPVLSARALQPENGDIQLQVNGSPVPLTGTGIIAPQLATSVTCTIEKGQNDTINFGGVHRDTGSYYSFKGVQLAERTQTISVSCIPQPDNASPYTVSLTFTGDTSDIYNFAWAGKGALKTSISDLFILPESEQVSGRSIPINGDAVPLTLDPTTQRYNLSVDWSLMGYSPNGKVPDEYGHFTATATYTVDVN